MHSEASSNSTSRLAQEPFFGRRLLVTLSKFAISVAILTYLANQAIADEQFAALSTKKKNWGLLGAGFVCSFLAIMIGTYRWKCLVNALHLPLNLKEAIKIGLMGQFFNFLAFGTLGADSLRAYYLSQKFRTRKSEAIVTVIADRFTGLLTMLFLGSIAFFVLERFELIEVAPKHRLTMQHSGRIVSVVALSLTVVMVATVVFPRFERHPLIQRLFRVPRLGAVAHRFMSILKIYRNRPGVLFFSLILSIVVNICFMLAIFFIAQGISQDSPSLASHTFIEPISMVCNAIPLPGGLGGMEFALSMLYRALGSQSGIVVAFTYRLSLLLVAAIGGVVWFLNRKRVETEPAS